ncbi:MAG: ATP-binding protein, partial [Oscillospiraceae bacterium]|nr:ATP-binding protein [Oscillospiraceae bacterium]
KAIEWVLWPAWNLNVSDLDFYNMDTTNPIIIEASISEIPEDLLTEDRYGLYLRDYEAAIRQIENDEPSDDRAKVLTIRLMIDESLEPEWTVITNRTEPKQISQKDRRLFALGVVGFDYEKDFAWGRTSILQKFANSSNKTLHIAYMQAMRTAVEKTDLSGLDESIADVHRIGQQFGVSFDGTLHNRLLMQNGSYSNSVGMFDDRVPFLQRGLGSKRLLSMGMNIHFSTTGCLILIDEIETGLVY